MEDRGRAPAVELGGAAAVAGGDAAGGHQEALGLGDLALEVARVQGAYEKPPDQSIKGMVSGFGCRQLGAGILRCRLLLRDAVERAQTPDQLARLDPDDATVGEHVLQRTQRCGIV